MRRLLPTLAIAVTVLSACGTDGRYAALDDIPSPSAAPAQTQDASPGTYTVDCGRNEGRHLNADNVVIAPGQPNGAHHTHEYIGNRTTTHTSTNETLAAGTTTCTNGDLSTYYWPALRLLDRPGHDAHAPGGGAHGNTGEILPPARVVVQYTGSPVSKVVPLPRFTRLITGDATARTAAPGGSGAGPPADATPADKDPAAPTPATPTPATPTPATPTPAAPTPAAPTPAGGDPADGGPAGGDPAGSAPAGGDPAGSGSVSSAPAGSGPADGGPAGSGPAGSAADSEDPGGGRWWRGGAGDGGAGDGGAGDGGAGDGGAAGVGRSGAGGMGGAGAGGVAQGAGVTGVVRWGCEGVAGWVDRYPLCEGRRVVRGFEFPSCWDGRNVDSASHRAHVQFPASNGVCAAGTFPVPRLRIHVFYDVPAGRPYAIDSFPEQERDPRTDHAMGINVMPDHVMAEVAGCLNAGRQCP
ncbi:hypothetical protein GCM10010492_73880 [Saccharothrix mutabilis subsp. mutabilis]|uniref:DUF1996 domain-containing protein n=2 Tax=Saccharothrix mutabilis TaxID=33921 RepID=A0ABN0UUL9_9PSEU